MVRTRGELRQELSELRPKLKQLERDLAAAIRVGISSAIEQHQKELEEVREQVADDEADLAELEEAMSNVNRRFSRRGRGRGRSRRRRT